MFAFAVIMGLFLVTVSFAQTPAAPKATPAKPAVTEKAAPAPAPAPAPEKKATKEKVHQYTGEVTAMDTAAKTLTVKGKQGEKIFDVTDVKMEKEVKAGDKVMVKYTEKDGKMAAKSVKAVKAEKKVEKKETKPAEKPATEKPAAPAKAPAATPAPAPAK